MFDRDEFLSEIDELGTPEAEAHGVLTGYLCAHGRWEDADDEELESLLPPADGPRVRRLLHQVLQQLDSDLLDFTPVIPDDDSPFEQRLEGLRAWCEQFLAGYGLGIGDTPLAPETREILTDFAHIVELDTENPGYDPDDDSERPEFDFIEVYEFTRAAALTLYSTLPEGDDEDRNESDDSDD